MHAVWRSRCGGEHPVGTSRQRNFTAAGSDSGAMHAAVTLCALSQLRVFLFLSPLMRYFDSCPWNCLRKEGVFEITFSKIACKAGYAPKAIDCGVTAYQDT